MGRYVIKGGRAGYDRLKVLARAWMPTTSGLLDRVGVRSGMRCLDLGCGSGDVTFEIARRIGPGGRVIGLDMDETKLALARESSIGLGMANVEFRVGNVTEWSDDGAYDLVYCRFLLQHLSRPLDLLRRMWSAVRTGGLILVEDTDFEGTFCQPPNVAFDFQTRTYCQVLSHNGGDPTMGRKLYQLAQEAGITGVNLSLVQRVEIVDEAKALPHLTLAATADAIVDAGIASTDEVNANLADLASFLDDPTTIIGSPRVFQLWAKRVTG